MNDLYRLFVYGTLRPGGTLHAAIEQGVKGTMEGATATGDIYYVTNRGGYPVANFDGDGTIHGTMLLVDEYALDAARRIELGAGYTERIVKVTVGDETWDAITYHHHCNYHGDPVPHGDWLWWVEVNRDQFEHPHDFLFDDDEEGLEDAEC